MSWTEVFLVFLMCHLAGDFLLQTDWQAMNKGGGLGGRPEARNALLAHVGTYTLAFVPALIWLGDELSAAAVIGIAAVISIPHLIVDDGRLLMGYMVRVKHAREPNPGLVAAVDQAIHILCLWGTALLVVS